MWTYFFMFLALVAGTFTGMGVMLLFFAVSGKKRKPKEKAPKEEKTPPETIEPADEGLPEIPLTRKMPPKDFSVADFNCAADGVDEEEHIASQQQRQDGAYNTLKRRKEK